MLLQIALVLVDEVHLLNESRGSALEAGAIGRVKLVSQKLEMQQVVWMSLQLRPLSLHQHLTML